MRATADTNFAWQGIAGVRFPVTDSVDLSLRYRYFRQDHIDVVANNGVPGRVNIKAHSVLAGVAFNFGGAQEAPPPAAPRRRPLRLLRRRRLRRLPAASAASAGRAMCAWSLHRVLRVG